MKLKDVKEELEAEHCNLAGSTFEDVNLSGASFRNVSLAAARMDDVNLSGLQIYDANLSHASIDECCIVGMTVRGILVTELLALYDARQVSKES